MTLERPIRGFHQDEHGDWVAQLDCGHDQHVRHKPPFWTREWVLTPEGRSAKLGASLPCVLCERFELPAAAVAYKRTPDFDATSIPAGLRRDHSTKPGVWGVIHVLEGQLRYAVEPPLARVSIVDAAHPGIVVPQILHRVEPLGAVRFHVAFHRVERGGAA